MCLAWSGFGLAALGGGGKEGNGGGFSRDQPDTERNVQQSRNVDRVEDRDDGV